MHCSAISRSFRGCLAALLLYPAVATAAPRFSVAPTGADSNDGSPERPFATLERARDAVRALHADTPPPSAPVVVEIAGGTYSLKDTFTLGAADSGTSESPVIYQARAGETVRIQGARTFRIGDFRPVTKAALVDRLDPAARGHVVALDLKASGVTAAGPFPAVFSDSGGILAVFSEGRRLPLARWPNTGHTIMVKTIVNGDKDTPGVFAYEGDRPSRWLRNPAVWLKGHWRVGWEDPAMRVAKIDPEARTITFAQGLHNGIGSKYHRPGGSGEEPWWAINLVEEIDQPGEWAIAFDSGTLYLWPDNPDPAAEVVIAQLKKPLFQANGARNVHFVGLTFEYSLGDGVMLRRADGNRVAGCTIRRISGRGVVLDGRRSEVRSCDIHEIGAGAILATGGSLRTLEPSGIAIVNNHIHHYGQLKAQYSAAVHAGAFSEGAPNNSNQKPLVGARIANNLIHHGPRDAILVGGADNVFELNEIHSCGFASKDLGAFYSWLDWTIRGIEIRYNFIHNTVGGVNPDDGASGMSVHGNVFAGPRVGVWIASGPDHRIRNNIFVKEKGAVFGMDARGVSRGYATNKRLIEGVMAVHPGEEPWRSRFPEVAGMLDNRPELPWRTEFVGNVIVTSEENPYKWAIDFDPGMVDGTDLLRLEGNFITSADPGFTNAAGGDFSLRPDAEVYRRIPGFPAIPWERIGLQVDEFRPRLPGAAEAGRTPDQNPFADDGDSYFGT